MKKEKGTGGERDKFVDHFDGIEYCVSHINRYKENQYGYVQYTLIKLLIRKMRSVFSTLVARSFALAPSRPRDRAFPSSQSRFLAVKKWNCWKMILMRREKAERKTS